MDFGKLHNEIYVWKNYAQTSRFQAKGYWEARRKLTTKEWREIENLLETDGSGYFCQMSNSEFGFQLAMAIYKDSAYPGVPPECVFVVEPKIMPGYIDDNRKCDPETRWEGMWIAFSKHTHSERNARILQFYKMEPPRDKVHYAY